MKQVKRLIILFFTVAFLNCLNAQSDLIITGVIDGPLTGGQPKAIEFFVINSIADLSEYGFGSANNGGGSDGQEFTFPSISANSGKFLYLAAKSGDFNSFFGFQPDFTGNAANINGDDALELFRNGSVVDVFGDINVDGSGKSWEYMDGWAYRKNNSGPDGSNFVLANWQFSGPNALDGASTNNNAGKPFPVGSYTRTTAGDAAPGVASTSPVNGATGVAIDAKIIITFTEDVDLTGEWFSISGNSSGLHAATVNGGPQSFTLDPVDDFHNNESVTVTIKASAITDQDADDPPDNMIADFNFHFITISSTSTYEIFDIQGRDLASPYDKQTVTTTQNIVTAVGAQGFAMQTPDNRADGDSQASDGIWVYTGSSPTVVVGDMVDVTGKVIEFYEFTEFTNSPNVQVISKGNPLPSAVELDASRPDPNVPQNAAEFERFEGMRIHIAEGMVTGANQNFSTDQFAEVHITSSGQRTFREPGIVYPGLPGLPVWDGNPEVFEMDVDRIGLPNQALTAGTKFQATGILGFEFGDFELWPTSLELTEVPDLPKAVQSKERDEITIGSFNIERLFASENIYSDRLVKLSKYIRIAMQAPDILAIQEVGGQTELDALAAQIAADNSAIQYKTYLIGSNQNSDILLAFLVRNGISVNGLTELGASETYTFNGQTSLLHDRAPLKLRATLPWGKSITILNLHLRSLRNIEGDSAENQRVRFKRDKAAKSVAQMVQNLQSSHTDSNLVVLGDFNAFEFSDGYVHVLGQITGKPASASQALLPGTDLVNPDLINQVLNIPQSRRYSYNHEGNAQVLDHILTSASLDPFVAGFAFAHGNSDAAEQFRFDSPPTALYSSDHDGAVLYIGKTVRETITLSEFSADIFGAAIKILWTTSREFNIVGYNIYRSINENGNYSKINNQLIAAAGGADSGASYYYDDYLNGQIGQTYYYKLESVSSGFQSEFYSPVSVIFDPSSVAESGADLPKEIALMQNYPNPFNPETTIEFALPHATEVSVRIYNVLGVEVKSLTNKKMFPAGINRILWNGHDNSGHSLNSGVFYVQMRAGNYIATRKVVLIR